MARHKLPQEVIELRGTGRKDRGREKAPAIVSISLVDVTDIANKSELLKTSYARELFIQKCSYLEGLKMLDASYIDDLISYAKMCELRKEALESLQLEGKFSPRYDANGIQIGFIENPNLGIVTKLSPIIAQLGAKFGFSPIDRVKIPKVDSKETPADKLKKMLNGKL